jgi:hypothetical protein
MNRYKQLVSNGCSFVYDCHEMINFNFTKPLAKKLKCFYKNLALGGASNQRMFRTTFDWIEKNKSSVSETLFIIGLTETSRTEVFLFDKWRIILPKDILDKKHHGNLPLIYKGNVFGDDVEKWNSWFKHWVKYFQHDKTEIQKLNRDVLLFDSYVKQFNSQVIFFNSFTDTLYDSTKERINYFSFKNYYELVEKGSISDTWFNTYEHEDHPHRVKHEEFANNLYKYILEDRDKEIFKNNIKKIKNEDN